MSELIRAEEYQSKLDLYEKIVDQFPDIQRKGAKNPYTSINGHMFSFLGKDGVLGLRLPKQAREAFIVQFNTKLSEQYGAVMKEYVDVPDALLADTAQLTQYFQESYDYVSGLKPKPTTQKKK